MITGAKINWESGERKHERSIVSVQRSSDDILDRAIHFRNLPDSASWYHLTPILWLHKHSSLSLHVEGGYFHHKDMRTRLKVPKCEICDRSDFHYFYTIKPFWIDDFGVKILTYFFKFWGSQASFSFLCAS
jgi:hypothetical protein